jgi:dolichol-phosphate mannosyltransferase
MKISVVCPVLNEEEGLPHFQRELCRVLNALGQYDYEVIFVDDGSSDGSLEILRHWARSDSRLRYVSLSRNFGVQAAFFAGMEHAEGDAIILMDADLQHPPAVIPELVRSWEAGHDVVVTLRNEWRRSSFRRFASRCFSRLLRRLSPMHARENISDFCLLSRRAVGDLLRMRETHRWLRGLIQWLGYSMAEVTYTPAERSYGKTKFTLARLFGYSFDALLSFSRAPLRLAAGMGTVCFLLGLGIVGRGLLGLLGPSWQVDPGMIILLASIYLVGGAVLFSIGLVGEYVGRIFEQVKDRPIYLLQETEKQARGIRAGPEQTEWTTPERQRRGA